MPRQERKVALALLVCVSFGSMAVANRALAAAFQGKVEQRSPDASLHGKVEQRSPDAPLHGKVEQRSPDAPLHGAAVKSAQPGRSSRMLQGGVKDDASLNSSLKVIPGATDKRRNGSPSDPWPLGSQIDQFQGNREYAPGQPMSDPRAAMPFGTRRVHVIAPISDYVLVPGTGSVSSAPGWGVQSISTFGSGSVNYPGSATSTSSTKSGVTSYVPGYEVQKINERNSFSSVDNVSITRAGVTSYTPGYEVLPIGTGGRGVPLQPFGFPGVLIQQGVTSYERGYDVTASTSRSGISSFVSGYELATGPSRSGVTTYDPGYQVSISTAHDGLICWDSRNETPGTPSKLIKQTLGGLYYTQSDDRSITPLRAKAGKLFTPNMFAQPVVMDAPMAATGLLLPEFRGKSMEGNISWDQWYKHVGKSIYGAWQTVEVCPGIAKVRVTVTRARDLSCQVVDFAPAPFVDRDAIAETAFREAAIKSVNAVTKYEIPEFPKTEEDVQQVTFVVEMKRTIDGPLGFDVASAGRTSTQAQPVKPPVEPGAESAAPPPASQPKADTK